MLVQCGWSNTIRGRLFRGPPHYIPRIVHFFIVKELWIDIICKPASNQLGRPMKHYLPYWHFVGIQPLHPWSAELKPSCQSSSRSRHSQEQRRYPFAFSWHNPTHSMNRSLVPSHLKSHTSIVHPNELPTNFTYVNTQDNMHSISQSFSAKFHGAKVYISVITAWGKVSLAKDQQSWYDSRKMPIMDKIMYYEVLKLLFLFQLNLSYN